MPVKRYHFETDSVCEQLKMHYHIIIDFVSYGNRPV